MSKSNPYRDWLGLGPEYDRPNYYQLLGIGPVDCADKKTVVEAANRQLAKLKLHRDVEDRAALQQLADEIKAAAKCLASSQSRNAYNASLLNSTLRQPGTAEAGDTSDSKRASGTTEPKNKSPLQAIPAAIPLAIPIDEPNTAELPAISTLDLLAAAVPAVSKSPQEFRLDTKKVLPRRRNPWPLLFSGIASLAAVSGAVILLRSDLHEKIFGKSDNKITAVNSNSTADPQPEHIKAQPAAPSAAATVPRPAAPMESTSTPETPPVQTTVNSSPSSVPEMSLNNTAPFVPAESSSETPNPVERVKEVPLPDAAVDFYARSVISALAINDLDTAVELYSRIDPDAVSDKRLDMLQRLGTIANAYKKYFDWLKSSADAIPGGTSLEIGPENLPCSIVESSAQSIVYRDRGKNWRAPLELVPRSIAWGIIDQMRTGESTAPILKAVVRSIGEFDSAATMDQVLASASEYSSDNSFGLETKAALVAWLQTDRPLIAKALEPGDEINTVRFADIVAQLSTEISGQPVTADRIHQAVFAAFQTNDLLDKLARLEIAKRAATNNSDVGLSSCIQQEIARHKKPADRIAEMISHWESFEKQKLDARQTQQLCVRILQFAQESGPFISLAQQRSLMRVAETQAVQHPQLEYLLDAIRQAATRE